MFYVRMIMCGQPIACIYFITNILCDYHTYQHCGCVSINCCLLVFLLSVIVKMFYTPCDLMGLES